jgi:hypothetical protein
MSFRRKSLPKMRGSGGDGVDSELENEDEFGAGSPMTRRH